MSESRIHVLNNGRSPAKRGGDFITRAQAEQMVMAERAENERMVTWYMQQIPELVAKMMADMCKANGLEFKGPEQPQTPAADAGQSGDAAAPDPS